MDRRIEVKVFGNHLWKDGNRAGVQGEGNVTTLRISFDEGWDEYAKSITFFDAKGRNPVKRDLGTDLLEEDSTLVYLCKIPPEPLTEAGWCSFIIEGYIEEARQRSVETQLEVMPARNTDDAVVPGAPTPTQAEQLRGEIEKIIDDVQKAAQAAQSAELAGQHAAEAAESAERAQSDAQAAEESARAAENSLNQMGDDAAAAAASAAAAKASENAAATSAKAAQDAQTGAEKAKYAVENLELDAYSVPSGFEPIVSMIINMDKEVLGMRFGIPKGYSPTVEVTAYEEVENWGDINIIRSGHDVTITDEEGTKTFRVRDGRSGTDGKIGKDGGEWVPEVDSEGNLSWDYAEASELYPVPTPVNIVQMVLDAMPDSGGEVIPGPSDSVQIDTSDLLDKTTYDPQGKATDIFQYVHDQGFVQTDEVVAIADDVSREIVGNHNSNTTAHADIREIANSAAAAAAEAKTYTDEKVKGLGKGDMLASVYDPAGLKKDIFLYIGEMTSDALTDARAYADELLEGAQVSSGGGVLECYLDQTEFWEVNDAYQSGSRVVLWDNNELWNLVYAETDVEYRFQNVSPDGIRTAYLTEEGWSNGEEDLGGGGVPTDHAVNDTTYGKGSGAAYGHVKLSSETNSYDGVAEGVAATPLAVKTAYDKAVSAAGLVNRTTKVNAADTNYTTLMARGTSLHTADTTPAVNGAICWTYK